MFSELMSMFHQSPQGQQAMQAIMQRGYSQEQAMQIMQAAHAGAINGMNQAGQGQAEPHIGLFNIFGGHSGAEFLTGAITGFLRGDGFVGGLADGAFGMIGGHVAEYIAQYTGMNRMVAGELAAVATPFLVHFAHQRLSGHPGVVQQYGQSPFFPQQQW
jgi:hypothetical protein